MKAFKLLALTSCVLLAAGNGVAQQNFALIQRRMAVLISEMVKRLSRQLQLMIL